ncbi:MAG TPA: SRPBCC family protein [Opitutaceae bacterium]|nr:SRPBCC family protein [Opitutaceae bacterium]
MSVRKNHPAEDTSNREIVISRIYDAPRDLAWRAMTDPQHVANWWGPRGFTTTIEKMDLKVGGVWKHTMRGTDGALYPNKSIFKEIVRHERIVFSHGGGREEGPGATFLATWTFEEPAPGKTRVTARMVFPTPEARDFVAREFGAVEGGKQTLERLAEYLPTMPPATRDFVLTRTFDAPRELVWAAWTDPEHLKRWFGPKGFTLSTCVMELRPGGVFHYGMKSPDGHEMWGKWTFVEIVKPEKLVVIVAFSDAKRGVTRHPLATSWPLETLSTTTFTEHEGKTTLTLHWSAYNATEAERRTFDSSHESMTQGWGGTMEQLEAYLAQAKRS